MVCAHFVCVCLCSWGGGGIWVRVGAGESGVGSYSPLKKCVCVADWECWEGSHSLLDLRDYQCDGFPSKKKRYYIKLIERDQLLTYKVTPPPPPPPAQRGV